MDEQQQQLKRMETLLKRIARLLVVFGAAASASQAEHAPGWDNMGIPRFVVFVVIFVLATWFINRLLFRGLLIWHD